MSEACSPPPPFSKRPLPYHPAQRPTASLVRQPCTPCFRVLPVQPPPNTDPRQHACLLQGDLRDAIASHLPAPTPCGTDNSARRILHATSAPIIPNTRPLNRSDSHYSPSNDVDSFAKDADFMQIHRTHSTTQSLRILTPPLLTFRATLSATV